MKVIRKGPAAAQAAQGPISAWEADHRAVIRDGGRPTNPLCGMEDGIFGAWRTPRQRPGGHVPAHAGEGVASATTR